MDSRSTYRGRAPWLRGRAFGLELATCSSSCPARRTAHFSRKNRARRGANAALQKITSSLAVGGVGKTTRQMALRASESLRCACASRDGTLRKSCSHHPSTEQLTSTVPGYLPICLPHENHRVVSPSTVTGIGRSGFAKSQRPKHSCPEHFRNMNGAPVKSASWCGRLITPLNA